MEWYFALASIVGALVFLLILGLPVAFSLAFVSLGTIVIVKGLGAGIDILTYLPFSSVVSWNFTMMPAYILMAEVLVFTGVTQDLYDMLWKWLGKLPGGLALASVGACAIFASLCGGSVLTAIAIGLIAIPEMLKRNYDKGLATGSVAGAGSLGILIPPSIIMIIYGVVVEQPIGKLFIAGIIPGIILATLFSLYILIRVKMKPALAPHIEEQPSWGEKFRSLRAVAWPMAIVMLVLGGIYGGVFNATEAGGIGAVAAILICLIQGKLSWSNLRPALLRTVRACGFIAFIIIGAMMFAYVLSYWLIAQEMAEWIIGLGVSRWVILLGVMLVCVFLGMLLEPVSIIFITMPIFFPSLMALGFDPIWLGVLLVVNMELANMTPPVGLNVFAIYGLTKHLGVSLGDVFKGVTPFALVDVLMLIILCIFPELALWLPSTMW